MLQCDIESRKEARQKVLQDCGLVMGRNIYSTLPGKEVNWTFDIHTEKRIGEIVQLK